MIGLAVIQYSSSIRNFLNSWPINYDSWSYMISIGLGYPFNHIVYTKFTIDIALFSSYWVILNHLVTGSMTVTAFRITFHFFPFLLRTQGTIISTPSLFHFISSGYLADNLPHHLFHCCVRCKVSQLLTSFRTASLNPFQYKCWRISISVLSIPRRRIYVRYQCNM